MLHWTRASRRAFSGVALLLVIAPTAAPAGEHDPPGGFTLAVLAVTVNREAQREPVIALRDRNGNASIAASDLTRWRLRLPAAAPTLHRGERYFALAAYPGLVASIDERAQALTIDAPAALFTGASFDAGVAAGPIAVRSATGGFLNYDLLAMRSDGQASTAGAFEAGAFGRWGSSAAPRPHPPATEHAT
jgi:hypothetical protein